MDSAGQQEELLGSKEWCVELQKEIGVDPHCGLHMEFEGNRPLVSSLTVCFSFF